ncbi:hypothetical protein [Schinkia azotoformans]|uniref:hypothetical protein n=1 Tax=Schinkia azotoformans TaxID=1454 RepID=UPI002DB59BD7|nr:hypothetical protein [Schinkia azotoformans]MEC1714600.1 hypothetical protein [Schinkia azotoformans]MEC1742949.1 hypothetical protein [Schinkia azotoformans]MEC1745374.1 hypothetical protein [Schinkia azotoformans]MEC1757073.1 hypothetical protein [Schinkia azotoformans]MEC1768250.1 hypothetical protein [Schinkia azotoformans]
MSQQKLTIFPVTIIQTVNRTVPVTVRYFFITVASANKINHLNPTNSVFVKMYWIFEDTAVFETIHEKKFTLR